MQAGADGWMGRTSPEWENKGKCPKRWDEKKIIGRSAPRRQAFYASHNDRDETREN